MALINCPECNEEISDTVKTCPKCGYGITKPKVNKYIKIAGILTILLVVIGVAVAIFGRAPLGKEQSAVINGVNLLQNKLLKPDTIRLYEAYVNEDFNGDGISVFLHFSSENSGGGTTEDYAVISAGKVYFETSVEDINEMTNENERSIAIDGSLHVSLATSQILQRAEQWVSVDIDNIMGRLN